MTLRFSDSISPDNPARAYSLDWSPAVLSIVNTSQYTVYLNIGRRDTPSIASRSRIVAPFSTFVGSVAGSRDFGVFVDHAGDSNPSYVYPIAVTFSELAGDVSAPLSGFFPVTQPIATVTRYTGGTTGPGSGSEIPFNRIVFDYRPGLNITTSRIDFNLPTLMSVALSLSFSAMTAITLITLEMVRQVPGLTQKQVAVVSEFPASGQATTTLTINKIVPLTIREQLWVVLTFSGTSLNIDAGGTLTFKQLA